MELTAYRAYSYTPTDKVREVLFIWRAFGMGFSEWPESYPRRVEFSTPGRPFPCDPSSGLLQTISSPARERTVKRRAYSFQSLRLSELAAFRAHSLKSLQLIELTAFKAYSFQSLQLSELIAFRAYGFQSLQLIELTAYRAYSL
jgi:hypothetical protein